MKEITTQELEKLVKKGQGYVLVDVRQKDEHKYGLIPTAKSVPLSEFGVAWGMSPDDFKKKYGFDKPQKKDVLIVYCRTGGRSANAAQFLMSHGFNVVNYCGSVQEWSKIDKNVKMY